MVSAADTSGHKKVTFDKLYFGELRPTTFETDELSTLREIQEGVALEVWACNTV